MIDAIVIHSSTITSVLSHRASLRASAASPAASAQPPAAPAAPPGPAAAVAGGAELPPDLCGARKNVPGTRCN